MPDRPRILVSNDDGYLSEGLKALVAAVEPLGEVWVVAPDREQSAASHAISLHRPLRIHQVSERWYHIDGTPTDCSYLAIHHILKDRKPTLMVSGINHGANLADDVTYSGTVAAAMEACILGVPSIAFSLVSRRTFDFTHAARFAHQLARAALSQPLPERLQGHPAGTALVRLRRGGERRSAWAEVLLDRRDGLSAPGSAGQRLQRDPRGEADLGDPAAPGPDRSPPDGHAAGVADRGVPPALSGASRAWALGVAVALAAAAACAPKRVVTTSPESGSVQVPLPAHEEPEVITVVHTVKRGQMMMITPTNPTMTALQR